MTKEDGVQTPIGAFEDFLRTGEEPANEIPGFSFLYEMYINADPEGRQIIQKFYLRQEAQRNVAEDQASQFSHSSGSTLISISIKDAPAGSAIIAILPTPTSFIGMWICPPNFSTFSKASFMSVTVK